MNKTVTINISGIIFHIEEDAFEVLRNYLLRLRSRFSQEEGCDEIMADIEARIAELLKAQTGVSKEVIVMADVDAVIAVMGSPEAFADGEEPQNTQNAGQQNQQQQNQQQQSQQQSGYGYKRRRLFRDPDDRIVGGVCSGLGHYFDINPIWIRLTLAVSFFVFGSGFLLYILLLIIMPKAETTAEKLEMRGEPVDVNNISRSIKEDFENFKRRMEDLGEEASDWSRRQFGSARENYNSDRRNTSGLERVLTSLFDAAGRIFAFVLLVIGVGLLISLLTSTFTFHRIGPDELGHSFRNLFNSNTDFIVAVIAFFLVFGIPAMMMIYQAVKALFNIKVKTKVIGYSALTLWIIGIILGVYSGVGVAANFRHSGHTTERFLFDNTALDTLQIEVAIDKDLESEAYNNRHKRHDSNDRRYSYFTITTQGMKFGTTEMNIFPSKSGNYELVIHKYSEGSTREEAELLSRQIRFQLKQEGNRLIIPGSFTIGHDQKWRAQEVELELYVPAGKVINLDESSREIIHNVENMQNTYDPKMAGRRWMMGKDMLTCIDCNGLDMDNADQGKQSANTPDRQADSADKARLELEKRIERMADSMRNASGKK
ncbi:MAG: PspC domain-containing protein [Bacteroidia bacterium]|jgi:phage shock protein PspC (stress-responsive transcriptional regulator)|nr:PspC domain-containing protein [Bacteroidia bacterium]